MTRLLQPYLASARTSPRPPEPPKPPDPPIPQPPGDGGSGGGGSGGGGSDPPVKGSGPYDGGSITFPNEGDYVVMYDPATGGLFVGGGATVDPPTEPAPPGLDAGGLNSPLCYAGWWPNPPGGVPGGTPLPTELINNSSTDHIADGEFPITAYLHEGTEQWYTGEGGIGYHQWSTWDTSNNTEFPVIPVPGEPYLAATGATMQMFDSPSDSGRKIVRIELCPVTTGGTYKSEDPDCYSVVPDPKFEDPSQGALIDYFVTDDGRVWMRVGVTAPGSTLLFDMYYYRICP